MNIPMPYSFNVRLRRADSLVLIGSLALVAPHTTWSAAPPGFPDVYNTRHEVPPLTPANAVKSFHLPPGFHASLVAGEPDVQQPIGMTMDRRGRLWVAENYTYSERPLGWDTNLNDRILIFEDTNHDGHFNKRTVFWDQAKKLTSVAVGFGGVFALCPPKLLFLPDRNGDDVPDGPPEVLLDGFEDVVVWHNIANGLKFGPDGWLYGRQGIQGVSQVGVLGSSPEQRVPLNAGIWRYHPVTHRFEVVAEGTTNPWGSDWDDNGQLFFINTVIGHLWHVVPGAYYRRMYGEHARQHLYELIEQTADHFHWDTRETWDRIRSIGVSPTTSNAGGGHAHSGLMIYLADNWPAQYRNSLFTVNFHGKRLNNDRIERQGADYTAHHAPDFMTVGDPWFRGVDLLYGPDGGVYLSDWSDTGECHDADAIHRTSGRIYKVTYGELSKTWSGDVAQASNDELVRFQLHANDWFVRAARQTLQERAAAGQDMRPVHTALREIFQKQTELSRKLRALWGLYVTGGADESFLRQLLDNENEQIRVWAIQLLVDQTAPKDSVLAQFAQMARSDQSGLVLTFLASAMRRAPTEKRWPLALNLATRREFAEDRVLPLMIWYGIEPAIPPSTKMAVELARTTRIPKLRRFVARRVFEDLKSNPAATDQIVQLLAQVKDTSFQEELLTGISEALAGTQRPAAPASWASVASKLQASSQPAVRDLTLELSALFGERPAIVRLRGILADQSVEPGARRNALKILLESRVENLTPLLVPLLGQIELAPDAIRALAAIGDPQTMAILLQRYPSYEQASIRSELVNALASRVLSAVALLDAIQHGLIPRKEISPAQIRQLRSLENEQVDAKVNAIWPQLDESASGKKELFARYKQLLRPAQLKAANATEGRRLFQQTCGLCHTLFGEGAKIGPELTGADRQNLDYLLDNILDPSAVVPDNYRAWTVTMKDDRVLNGIILAQNSQTVTLQTISEKSVLRRTEIQSMAQSRLSLMPDGILQGLSDQQACDLIGYLMSPAQVALPAGSDSK